ncbi:MAG: Site-specific tyrosine recombinase XerC [Verrucomicrobiales bacterium]|nr:Site-specific tyrosine recombinase XerC [Verrucomicrobiales bacterium]
MKQTSGTVGNTQIPQQAKDSRLSPDGKWKSFPKVPNLLQYVSTGAYFARVKVDGKLIRQSLETDVFTTAKLKLPDFIKKQMKKKRVEGAPESFGDALKLYEKDLESEHAVSDSTKRYRKYCIKKLNTSWPELANTKLNRIMPADCKVWSMRFSKEVDEQYFNNVLGTFRAILKRGGISSDEDPASEVKRIGVKPTVLNLPSATQFDDILKHVATSGAGQQKDCANFVKFLAYSGCRLSEARQVKWSDVDFEKGKINVQNAKVRRTSGANRNRNVPMIKEMRELLETMAKEPHEQSDSVCGVGECEKSLRRACKLVGLEVPLTHHDLRHLFATRCIESGIDIPTVSRWLGHSDGGALAMRVYGHLRDEHSTEMAKKVSFGGGVNVPQKGANTESKKIVTEHVKSVKLE